MLIPNVSYRVLSCKDKSMKIILPFSLCSSHLGLLMVLNTRHNPAHSRFSAFSLASPSFWNTLSQIYTWFVLSSFRSLLKCHISQIVFDRPIKSYNLILTNALYPTSLALTSTWLTVYFTHLLCHFYISSTKAGIFVCFHHCCSPQTWHIAKSLLNQ